MSAAAVEHNRQGIGAWVVLWVVFGVLWAAFSVNMVLTLAAVASLAAIVLLLWRPGEPPVLMFICAMQWLQAAVVIFRANLMGRFLWQESLSRNIETATYLTLGWVTLLAAGASFALRGIDPSRVARATSIELSQRRLLTIYVAWTLAISILNWIMPAALGQLLFAASAQRFAVVFAILVHALVSGRGAPVAWGVLAFEVISGFLAFFSEFRVPLYVALLALLASERRFTARRKLLVIAVASATAMFGVVWSAIKSDYRDHMNQGSGAQVVEIDAEQQIGFLVEQASELDGEMLLFGLDRLVERLAYVEFFGYTIDFVPALFPHEDGRIWTGAFAVLVPRVLFPDKPVLESDTKITERYTGLQLGSAVSGTSISIGLPGLTYVDFGPVGMFAVALALGALYGFSYRLFIMQPNLGAISQGFAVAILVGNSSVGSAPSKTLGGLVAAVLVALVLRRALLGLLPSAAIREGEDAANAVSIVVAERR